MEPQRLGIGSECFDDLRAKFDSCLEIALQKMLETGLQKSTITAKVEIVAVKEKQEGEDVQIPTFNCQVSISMPIKAKVPAAVPYDLKIVRSKENGEFIIGSQNYTIFDLMDAQTEENE